MLNAEVDRKEEKNISLSAEQLEVNITTGYAGELQEILLYVEKLKEVTDKKEEIYDVLTQEEHPFMQAARICEMHATTYLKNASNSNGINLERLKNDPSFSKEEQKEIAEAQKTKEKLAIAAYNWTTAMQTCLYAYITNDIQQTDTNNPITNKPKQNGKKTNSHHKNK